MATGDVTISVVVEGGVTKSATFNSATRVKAKLYVDISTDADWQVASANNAASTLVSQANKQLEQETSITPKTYSAAS
jgi:uncharacterized protein YaiE (UPF0345 family)